MMGVFTRRRAGVTLGVCVQTGGVNARSTLAEKRYPGAKCEKTDKSNSKRYYVEENLRYHFHSGDVYSDWKIN